jgi:hypothetical protein
VTACAERLRLTEEYERLNRAYMALLELAEEAHTSPSADYIKLRTVATDARSDWEIARLEFLKHERTHLPKS